MSKTFKAYCFFQEYEIEDENGNIQLMELDTNINELKGMFHLECIEKMKRHKKFIDNEKYLNIGYFTIDIDTEVKSEHFCSECFQCESCNQMLDDRLIIERKNIKQLQIFEVIE